MISPLSKLSETELETAKRATKDRAQTKRIQSRRTGILTDRVSTFPAKFESLRDRFLEHAKDNHAFLDSIFTLHASPTDEEILQSVENRLFSLSHEYPLWFCQTPDADAKAHDLKRDHDITHGFIKAAPLSANQQAAIVRRKQERLDREQRIAERLDARPS